MSLTLTPNDVLQVITGQTCTIDTMVNYHDVFFSQAQLPVANQQFGQAVSFPGRTAWAITGATTTTICTGPTIDPVNSARAIDSISITNNHATASVDVTPIILSASVSYRIGCGLVTLLPGQSLQWTPSSGWIVPASTLLNMTKYVTADSLHILAVTFAGITGLSFPVLLGHVYTFEAALFHITNATTTGAQFGVGGVTATFVIVGAISTVLNSATAATMSTGVATAVDTAAIVQTTGAAANGPTWLAGSIQPSASGNLEIRAASEIGVAAGLTVLKGSWASVRETNN